MMSQARNAQSPFQMRKRSFNLTWGAWAGILAVMTAVGAAFAGSQILMMYPRPVKMIDFRYPSLPKAGSVSVGQLDENTPALFWSQGNLVVGRLSDLVAPMRGGELFIKSSKDPVVQLDLQELQEWCKQNFDAPIKNIALGQTPRNGSVNFAQVSEAVGLFESINKNLFGAAGIIPAVVPIELANPL